MSKVLMKYLYLYAGSIAPSYLFGILKSRKHAKYARATYFGAQIADMIYNVSCVRRAALLRVYTGLRVPYTSSDRLESISASQVGLTRLVISRLSIACASSGYMLYASSVFSLLRACCNTD